MKLYYPHKHYNSAYRLQVFPLLKAFIKNEGFTDAERQLVYGVSELDYDFLNSMDAADIVVLTMSWDYYIVTQQMALALALIEEAKLAKKVVWSINTGDFGVKLPYFPNLIVFRQSGYVSNEQRGHVGFPSILTDYVHKRSLGATLFSSSYGSQPIVGFCGHAQLSKLNALKEMTKQCLRNLRSHFGYSFLEPQQILSTTYLRASLLKTLVANKAVKGLFIKRKHYRAGVTKNKDTHSTTEAFYNNILESQYVLCVRGAGNFSVRFYETLMMGRIPLYVHTDGYLPLSNIIDWKSHVVWVDYKDRYRISEILLEFHEKLDQEKLIALFKSNRELWETKLTLSGFFKAQENVAKNNCIMINKKNN